MERKAGGDTMGAAAEEGDDPDRVVEVGRLADDRPVHSDDGIGGDYEGRSALDRAGFEDGGAFFPGYPRGELRRALRRPVRLIDRRRNHAEAFDQRSEERRVGKEGRSRW